MSTQQVILITGSSSGFGRLSAQALARQGHTVFASMRDVAGRNAPVRAELDNLTKSENLDLKVIELDVTDDSSVEAAVAKVIEQAGRIDVLINNAGAMYVGLTEAFTLEQVQRQFDVNFFSAIRMNRAVLPHMRRQRSGLLIHLSSIGGRVSFPFLGVYSASKFALEALAEAYRYELFGLGIDSLLVEPGSYASKLLANYSKPQDQARIAEYGNIAKRAVEFTAFFEESYRGEDVGDPQEVVDAIARLIDTPAGQRPLRTVCEPNYRIRAINEATAPIQRSLLEEAGMQDLLQLA